MDEVQEPASMPAVRLIFEYDGDQVRLVSQQPVDVAVTGFDLSQVQHPGHYIEMRNAANQPLGRAPVREAFPTSAEVFPEQPSEPITRIDLPKAQGAFTVVVPAPAEAAQFALVRVSPPTGIQELRPGPTSTTPAPGEPETVEIATFPLTAGPQRPGGNG